MSNGSILSAQEIDELLKSLGESDFSGFGSPKEKEKIIKDFDLTKISSYGFREILRTLEIIFDNYSRHLTESLRDEICSSYCEVWNSEVISSDELTNSIMQSDILFAMNLYPLKGTCFLKAPLSLMDKIAKHYLVNKGIDCNTYEITELKQIIMEEIFEIFMAPLSKEWIGNLDVKPVLQQIYSMDEEFNLQLKQGKLVTVILGLKIDNIESMVQIILPYVTIYPIINYLTYDSLYKKPEPTKQEANIIKDINDTTMTVTTSYKTTILLQDILNLQKGDIIFLDRYDFLHPDISINGVSKFTGKLLNIKNKLYTEIESSS